MRRTIFSGLYVFFLAVFFCFPAQGKASAGFVLKGQVVDTVGKPVEGGEVFVYDTARTRRPADFISPKTDSKGFYRIEVPAGRYWVVARVRSNEKYGPLMTTGRHSGEAQELEAIAGGELSLDFSVAEVREIARIHRKSGEESRRVEGRILDKNNKPVRDAYAFTRPGKNETRLPTYISAWSDEEGRYTMYLPAGSYCLGASVAYPPEEGSPCTELFLDGVKIDIANDIHLNYSVSRIEEGKAEPELTSND